MMLQSTRHGIDMIDLSSAPWTMHEFFAGSGLVACGLKGMFEPIWQMTLVSRKQLYTRQIWVPTISFLVI